MTTFKIKFSRIFLKEKTIRTWSFVSNCNSLLHGKITYIPFVAFMSTQFIMMIITSSSRRILVFTITTYKSCRLLSLISSYYPLVQNKTYNPQKTNHHRKYLSHYPPGIEVYICHIWCYEVSRIFWQNAMSKHKAPHRYHINTLAMGRNWVGWFVSVSVSTQSWLLLYKCRIQYLSNASFFDCFS